MLGIKKLLAVVTVSAVALGVVAASATPSFAVTSSDYDYDYSWSTDDGYNSYYTTSTLTAAEASGLAGFFAVYLGVVLCMGLVFYLYSSITTMVTAKKLGVDNAWMAFVPILNVYLMNTMAGLDTWMFLLVLVPGVNFVYMIYVYMKIAERRGFENWVGLLILVPFIGIFIPAYIAWGTPNKAAAAPVASPVEKK